MANASRGASGALSGAATGAALGTAIPGIGNVVGAVGGGIIGGLAGLFSGGDDDSQKYIDQAIAELIKVHVPDPEQQKIQLERYYSTGSLSPELEQAISSDPSAYEQIVLNTRYQQASDRALQQMQTLGEEGGLSLSDKAQLQEQLLTSANKDRANRDAITDEYARRGQLGSGMALQAQLQGAQASGDRDAMARLSALGGAQDRALQAIMGAGELGGKLGEQDYRRQADLAQARDRINMFNTQNAQNVRQRNVAAKNAAQEWNLQNNQSIANKNVDLGNQEEVHNKGLEQQRFQNDLSLAQAKANTYTGAANNAGQAAQRSDQQFGGFLSAAGQLGSGIAADNRWKEFMEKWGNKK